MSEFLTEVGSVEKETADEIEVRHKSEINDLEEKIKKILKLTKKSEKQIVEAQVVQMRFDIKARHMQEVDVIENFPGN